MYIFSLSLLNIGYIGYHCCKQVTFFGDKKVGKSKMGRVRGSKGHKTSRKNPYDSGGQIREKVIRVLGQD